jgi:DNA-binding XRE family transcriptional regulator
MRYTERVTVNTKQRKEGYPVKEKNQSRYPNIDAERVKKGLSQEELSKLLGITRKCYYNWQTNGCIPSSKLIELADLFDCSVDYLLGLSDIRSRIVTFKYA